MKNVLIKIKQNKWKVFSLFILAGVVFYFGYNKSNDESENNSTPEMSIVKKGDISISVNGSGQIYSKSQVDIEPQVAGDGLDIIKVAVENNQEVKEGDLIAVLDYSDAQKAIRDAELELENANLKYKSIKEDYDDDKADSYDKKIQKVTLAQKTNNLADAKENLTDYYIKAPFDGVVTGLSVEAGSSVSRSDTLASVITKEMYAKISLNEVDAVSVDSGDKVMLTFDAIDDLEIEGVVSKIDTIGTVEQGVVYYEVEISFEKGDTKLKPGMSVSAEIFTDSKEQVLTIPVSAVKTGTSGKYVQVLNSSFANKNIQEQESSKSIYYTEKKVETGISDGVNIEIISGLEENDEIIVKMNSSAQKSTNSSAKESTQGFLDSAIRTPGSGGGGSGMRK